MFPISDVILVVFEIMSIWLLSSSPMSFKCLIFPDFVVFESMWMGTFLRVHILDLFMKNWPSDKKSSKIALFMHPI